jgi:RNA polymerase sigma-70 factor (ECF subfamily)
MEATENVAIQTLYENVGPELHAYLCRLVIRPQVAEDLVQATFVRALENQDSLPSDGGGRRAWLFKVATHLALDSLRRHSQWRETMMGDLREAAESNEAFIAQSIALVGTPEMKTIAREHLAACFACTLRNLPEQQAAALLLKEVHGFSLAEISDFLTATPGQSKNWLHEARAYMSQRYQKTCALIAKEGICYQCAELDEFFRAGQGSPLPFGRKDVETRLREVAALRERPWGKWHRLLFSVIDELK